jgi:hypothetical protein
MQELCDPEEPTGEEVWTGAGLHEVLIRQIRELIYLV